MTNTALIGYVKTNEDSTEMELELADRLAAAIQEMQTLVEDIQRLQADHGTFEKGATWHELQKHA